MGSAASQEEPWSTENAPAIASTDYPQEDTRYRDKTPNSQTTQLKTNDPSQEDTRYRDKSPNSPTTQLKTNDPPQEDTRYRDKTPNSQTTQITTNDPPQEDTQYRDTTPKSQTTQIQITTNDPSKGTSISKEVNRHKTKAESKGHLSEKELGNSDEENESSSGEDNDVNNLDKKTLATKAELLQKIEDAVKKLSEYRKEYGDKTGISEEYCQAAASLEELSQALANLTEDKKAQKMFKKEEGKRIATIGGVGTLCDAIIVLFLKNNNFQDISEDHGGKHRNWEVTEALISYLANYSDEHPRFSKHFVSHNLFVEYSSHVIREILKKHLTENDLVSKCMLNTKRSFAIEAKCFLVIVLVNV